MMNISVSPIFNDPSQEYSGDVDYAETFIDQMDCLNLLSFLVTADRKVAERCLSKALDEYVEAPGGFMEWAQLNGRRAVLRHAVQIVRPGPRQAHCWSFQRNRRSPVPAAHEPFASITSLSAFERFVFVMSDIEGLSEEECAALLHCSVQDVATGREQARRIITAEDIAEDLTGAIDLLFITRSPGNRRCRNRSFVLFDRGDEGMGAGRQ